MKIEESHLAMVGEYNGNETFRPSLDRLQELKEILRQNKDDQVKPALTTT